MFVEAGECDVEIRSVLKIPDDVDQFHGVPIAADELVVQRDVEGFFFFEREFDDDDIDFGDTLLFENLQALMSGDDVAGGAVPDERLNEFELAEGAFKTTKTGGTRRQPEIYPPSVLRTLSTLSGGCGDPPYEKISFNGHRLT